MHKEQSHEVNNAYYTRLESVQAPEFARAIRRALVAHERIIANPHTNQAFRVAYVTATTSIGGNDLHLYHASDEYSPHAQVAYKSDGAVVDGCRYHTQEWFDLLAQVANYLD